jgi:hypothetical protein
MIVRGLGGLNSLRFSITKLPERSQLSQQAGERAGA